MSRYQKFSAEFKAQAVKLYAEKDCYDNAPVESFFHTLKTEHTHFERFETRQQAAQSVFEWIEVFYNRKRLHSSLDYLPPAHYERQAIA